MMISNDIIVVDSGSTDDTVRLASAAGAKVVKTTWVSYGASRNAGADVAVNNWVFALDADERISSSVKVSLSSLQPEADHLYGVKRVNYCEGRPVRFGNFGADRVFRFYNKRNCRWDDSPVHEKVIGYALRSMIKGHIDHYTISSREQYETKLDQYAILAADKYYLRGKKAGWVKRFLSPVYGFIKGYIFQLGFLDGADGYWLARVHARHTRMKYELLKKLNISDRKGRGRAPKHW